MPHDLGYNYGEFNFAVSYDFGPAQLAERIARRQAVLEQRAAAMSGLPDVAATGSIRARAPS